MSDLVLPHPKDALHKAVLLRTLTGIADDVFLASLLRFKGGTCAALLGWLDRFSVDLDFDLVEIDRMDEVRSHLVALFDVFGLRVVDESKIVPQYVLKYAAPEGSRSTLNLDITTMAPRANIYETLRLTAIDRFLTCQTRETMMANKLVALTDRFKHHGTMAGRDVYDIHHFFEHGVRYEERVIVERTGKGAREYLEELVVFIETHVTERALMEDLNVLVPYERLKRVRNALARETVMFLRDEITRLSSQP